MKTLGPEPDDPALPTRIDDMLLYRVGHLLATAGGLVIRLCEGEFGITRREWRVLAKLAQEDGILSSALAERAQLDRARTSRALTSLEAKQLVLRRPRPQDRREVTLHLTEAGRRLYERLLPRVGQINQELTAVLGEAERAALDEMLARLQGQADALLAQAALPKADRRRGRRREEAP